MSSKIHQLSKFPAFVWSEEVIGAMLVSLRKKQEMVLNKMSQVPDELKKEASSLVHRLDVLANIDIEEKTTNFETFLSIFGQKNAFFVQNHSILTDSTQNYHLPLTKERLANWHSLIGTENTIFAEPTLNQFLAWFNKPGLDRQLKAAIAHLWFVSISPSNKGNGFIARLITNMQLAKADGTHFKYYSLCAQLLKEQRDYQFILEQAQRGSLDITIWLQWFLNCLGSAYDASEKLLAPIIKKDRFWKKHQSIVFNKSQKQMLTILLNGFDEKLNTSTYARITNCSRDTALRDVNYLLEKNILIKRAGLGKNTNYSLQF